MSDTRELKIIVASEAGNGKTTIANQITNLLRLGGLDVDLVDDEPRQPLKKNAEMFAKMVCNPDIHVTVETKQSSRRCKNSGCMCHTIHKLPVRTNAIGKEGEIVELDGKIIHLVIIRKLS